MQNILESAPMSSESTEKLSNAPVTYAGHPMLSNCTSSVAATVKYETRTFTSKK